MKIQDKNTFKPPLVTVLMPIYNGADYVEEAIESVQKSTFRDFELVLVNDGSSDESGDICRAMAKKYNNIRLFTFRKNRGLVHALNFGVSKARGTYLCRLNQDDRMVPKRIATQVEFLDTHPEVVVVGSWIKLLHVGGPNPHEEIIRYLEKDEDLRKVWFILSPFSDPSVMYRKEVAVKLGGYDPDFFIAEDTQMWIRMATVGKLANIPKPLVEVRHHADATTVRQFRRLTTTTYRLHRWMHNNIEKAPIHIQLFWVAQLVSSSILPPRYIFSIYRMIKKSINAIQTASVFLREVKMNMNTIKDTKVMTHPTKVKVWGA
jgi:glycosyltransferase involved in cell wall biosynthesis